MFGFSAVFDPSFVAIPGPMIIVTVIQPFILFIIGLTILADHYDDFYEKNTFSEKIVMIFYSVLSFTMSLVFIKAFGFITPEGGVKVYAVITFFACGILFPLIVHHLLNLIVFVRKNLSSVLRGVPNLIPGLLIFLIQLVLYFPIVLFLIHCAVMMI